MPCEICGNEFVYQTSKRKYCSDKCKAKARRINSKEELKKYNKERRQKQKEMKMQDAVSLCIECNKPFKPKTSMKRKICSKECKKIRQEKSCSQYERNNYERMREMARIRDRLRSGTEKRKQHHRNSHERHKEKRNAYKRKQRIFDAQRVNNWEANSRAYLKKNAEKYALYKIKKNKYYSEKYHTDIGFQIKERIQSLVIHAFNKYSKEGKVKSSQKYGINYTHIFEHLGPCPGNIEEYDIDHVIPLSWFNFNREEEIKEAFKPSNHQWLKRNVNRSKRDVLPMNILFDEKLWI